LLDSLPPQHPDALHNRRDLRLTNRIMGNYRWLLRTLPPLLRPGESVLELGAGTGELALSLQAAGTPVDGLDLWPTPENWPAARSWHRADIRTFPNYDRYAAVFGNLIFHQFTDGELAELGQKLRATARLILACEPARWRKSQWLYRLLGPLFGANQVSLHDAHVSIGAGFRGEELPLALGLDPAEWTWQCHTTGFGAYHMVATRRA
jgi:SAM-dependent methyltransferase